VRAAINVQNLIFEIEMSNLISSNAAGVIAFDRELTASVEQTPENEAEVIPKLIESYTVAKYQQFSATKPYAPGAGWKTLLESEWQRYRRSIEENDTDALAYLLRNFFRNEGLSGFWGETDMFGKFCKAEKRQRVFRAALMKEQYEAWRRLFPETSLAELNAPKIGNPWGYAVDGNLLYEPVFEYHYHAHYLYGLLKHLESPVILEVGGGFGGLAYHLLKVNPSIKYIGVDLPENILLQTYYLSCAFPSARILTYGPELSSLTPEMIAAYDIILLPNFCIPDIPDFSCDLIVNIRSLAEMPLETVAEYLRQIDRIGKLWFFHENIYKKRTDGQFGVPSPEFPPMYNHLLIAASETRWPRYKASSAYPCQENLSIHRQAIAPHK